MQHKQLLGYSNLDFFYSTTSETLQETPSPPKKKNTLNKERFYDFNGLILGSDIGRFYSVSHSEILN